MIKKTKKIELFQSAEQDPTFNQFENELGTITSSVRELKGKYIITIPNAFKDFVNFFCPQNKQVFNVVGGLEGSINEERLPHHLANCKVQNKKCGGSVCDLFVVP